MAFSIERLISVRESLGINKSEAARRLNLTAMGYGRYESGARTPSYQTLCYMAQIFGTSYEYLCEETDDPSPKEIVISAKKEPELFAFVQDLRADGKVTQGRLKAYYEMIAQMKQDEDA